VIGNADFSLSEELQTSFINDIVKGLAHLHGSANICHGQLNLHACIVTPQWTVRLGNYGLNGVLGECAHVGLLKVPSHNLHGASAIPRHLACRTSARGAGASLRRGVA